MSVFRLFAFNNLTNCRNVLCSSCEEQKALISIKALEKLGIPKPPKRPMTPYIKFGQTIRSKIYSEEPGISANDTMKRIAEKWQTFDPERKKMLQKEYLTEMESYLIEREKYDQTITPEQKSLIEETKQKVKRSKQLSQLNKKKVSLGKPKRPSSAFIKYMMEQKAKRDPSMKYTEWLSDVSKKWDLMPEQDKKKYKEESESELQQYRSEMLAWEENMLRQGHFDVIRNKDLLEKSLKTPSVNKIP
ncbi:transcription factor A, mitochondrial isoform X2 [Copidosoma floridanum]|uniref:transcription factor A, mitochondrial isoform X2 n=1 Tax=Copidosoma floridanum TaxID=29053 RepID=UPI000C6FC4AC|nr:transcription factor A, mitochondrial isoform X2 [Copidosoma floridanum]